MYAFCERSTATPHSHLHIREVTDGRSYPGGGIPNPALCGADMLRGWDWGQAVTADVIRAYLMPGHAQPMCVPCADVALSALAARAEGQ